MSKYEIGKIEELRRIADSLEKIEGLLEAGASASAGGCGAPGEVRAPVVADEEKVGKGSPYFRKVKKFMGEGHYLEYIGSTYRIYFVLTEYDYEHNRMGGQMWKLYS